MSKLLTKNQYFVQNFNVLKMLICTYNNIEKIQTLINGKEIEMHVSIRDPPY